MFVDIDYFKNFNDAHGHEHGDLLLKSVAARLQSAVRTDDVVARLGGDEFVILLRKLEVAGSESVVDRIARETLTALRVPFVVAGQSFEIQASIGAAIYPRDGRTAPELLKNADAAMYAAKQAGRNRAMIFSAKSMQTRAQQMRRGAAIRQGLANSEFFLVYQPQVDALTGSPTGLEALLRWDRPGIGLVYPADFIPLAEELGYIKALGQRALEIASGQCLIWTQMDLHPRIAVNVSALQFQDPEWIDSVHAVLFQTQISPHFIDLEITESILIANPRQTAETLKKLNTIGITLTLDDFGTGYSSLSYLSELPFNTVKIDRSFVANVDQKHARGIAQAIVALAHSLGMRVIAEGVETPLQMTILRDMGVEEMQGYYFSKPLLSEEVPRWWVKQMNNAKAWLDGQLGQSGSG
jgi:diguanylate cyclase (GGDEF) domain